MTMTKDDNDKDESSEVMVLKSTEILLILTHLEYVTMTKMVLNYPTTQSPEIIKSSKYSGR